VKLVPTPLADAYVVELEPLRDERGWFARTFDVEGFAAAGLDTRIAQCNTSFNARAGTLRGLHYQAEPHAEAKLVRCTRGAVFDAIVDLRPGSATYCRWFGLELRADGTDSLYVPSGFAHGFQTLEDASEVHYQMSYHYVPEAARGVRWDDPAFGIEWPAPPSTISDRDGTYPDFVR
jgi:dTDP-4-dehydrorhamnose 3,5-epimerase